MMRFWSYLVVLLCASVTSAGVLNFPGNRDGLQDNLVSTLEKEKVLTPPSDSGLIIDSIRYQGNSNGLKITEVNPKDLPSFLNVIINAVRNENQSEDYNIIPFTKDDIIQLESSDICKNMCLNNIKRAPCNCKKEN